MALKVFIRTIFVRDKDGGNGSVLRKVRVTEFTTGRLRMRSERLR